MKRRTQKKQRRRRQRGGAWYDPRSWSIFSPAAPSIGQQVTDVAKSAVDGVQGAVQSTTAALTPNGYSDVGTTTGAVKLAGTPPEGAGKLVSGGRRRRTVRRRS